MRRFRSITSSTDANVYVGPFGELVVDDSNKIRIQDSVTPGGIPLSISSGNLTFADTTISTSYPSSITIDSTTLLVTSNLIPTSDMVSNLGANDKMFAEGYVANIKIYEAEGDFPTISTVSSNLFITVGRHSYSLHDVSIGENQSVGTGSILTLDDVAHSNGPTMETWYGNAATPWDPPGQHSLDIHASETHPENYVELASSDWNNFVGVNANSAFINTNWNVDPNQIWLFNKQGVLTLPAAGHINGRDGFSTVSIKNGNVTIRTTDLDDTTEHYTTFERSGNMVVDGSILPSGNVMYDLGSPDFQWKSLYVSNNTVYINNIPLSITPNGDLTVNGNAVVTNGNIEFPIGQVDLHNGGVQTGQVLQFNDAGYQSIITGPTPAADTNAQRLIIQGQRGNGNGEGGDVYFWAGDAEYNGGDIKIYAGDADNVTTGNGGYINIDAGNGYDYGGGLSLRAGYSTLNGGDINLSAGYAYGGTHGYVRINTAGSHNWTFKSDGNLSLPGGGMIDGAGYDVNMTAGNDGNSTYGTVNIVTDNPTGTSVWSFGTTGDLALPGGGYLNNNSNSSGDGNGYSTISLIPDGNLEGSDQYIILDPTAPGHIHIRAGGMQDNSFASLILGGENSFVQVGSGSNPPIYISSNNKPWSFNTDGSMTIPDNGIINTSSGNITVNTSDGNLRTWTFGANGTLSAPGDVKITGRFVNDDDGYLSLRGNSLGPTSRIHIRNTDGDPSSDVNIHLQTGSDGDVFEVFQLSSGNVTYQSAGGLRTNSTHAPIIIQTDTTDKNNTWVFSADGSVSLPGAISSTSDAVFGHTTVGEFDANGAASFAENVEMFKDLYVHGNINFTGNVTQNTVTVQQGIFTGENPSTGFSALYAGILQTPLTFLPATVFQMNTNSNEYTQMNYQNLNGGNVASAEYVITSDNGDDVSGYIDMGIASSGWDGTQTNSLGTAVLPNDGWIYVQNGTGTSGGHLVLGTTSPTKKVKIVSGGSGSSNIVAEFSPTGLNVPGVITSTFSGNLTGNVSGNSGSVTNGVYTTGSYSNPGWITSLAYSKLTGAPNLANVATSGSYNDLSNKPTGLVTTSDVGTVTNTMLAGSIANNKLANSNVTINGTNVSLGGSATISAMLPADVIVTPTQGGTTTITNAMYRVVFVNGASVTGHTVVLPDTNTCVVGQSFVLVPNQQNYAWTVALYGGGSSGKTWTAGQTLVATVVAQRGGSAETTTNWSYSWQGYFGVTGSGSAVFATAPTISNSLLNGSADLNGAYTTLGQVGERFSTWSYTIGTTTVTPTAISAGGVFTIPATSGLSIGQAVTITGTNGGTGSINGYSSGTTYYVIGQVALTNATSVTLAATRNSGTAITTTAGTISGLTMSFAPHMNVNPYGGNGHLVNITATINANFDVSYQGVYTANNAYSLTLIINQGSTPYLPQNLYIGGYNSYMGAATTISWQGGSAPTGNANKKDVVTLSWLPSSVAAATVVLGQLVSYG